MTGFAGFSLYPRIVYQQRGRSSHYRRVLFNEPVFPFCKSFRTLVHARQSRRLYTFNEGDDISKWTDFSIPRFGLNIRVRKLCQTSPKTEHSASAQSAVRVLQRLHELEEGLRVRGYSLLRWGLGLVLLGVTTLYLFREKVRENVADEVADVASRSLGDENVVNKANEMTKLVLQDIINDPETTRLASNFVMSVLSRDDVRKSAVDLTMFVLKDPKTHLKVSDLAAKTLKDLINQPEIRTLLLSYIKDLILDESTWAACKDMLRGLLDDPEMKDFMADSLGNLVASAVVINKAIELGKSVTHEVVSDTEIQRQTGDALWTLIKKTVTPGWFSGEG